MNSETRASLQDDDRQTIIEIRPHRGGLQCFEAPGAQPYHTGPNAEDYAVNYAKERTAMRRGEIRILNSGGKAEQVIPFDNRAQKV